MAQRRIGPTLGAGVVVIERDSARLIDPAPLGVTVYVTPTAKGSTTKLNSTYSQREFYRKLGNRISGFDGPDCGYDFWDHSVGKGELHVVRVAATGMRSAIVDIWSRELTATVDGFASSDGKGRPVIRVTAASGGRWAGRRRTMHREVASLGNIGVTTLTTGLTMLQDEWVGGIVALDGVSTKTYTVTGNTTSGVVSVSSDSNMTSDLGAGTDKGYTLHMDTEVGPDGNQRVMGILIGDGETNPSTEFSMSVFVDEQGPVKRWPNLSMDPASKNYFVRIINDDQSNYDITVADLLAPANPAPTDRRPANAQGVISAISTTTLTIKPFQARRLVGTSNPTFALVGDTDLMRFPDTIEFICTTVALGNATFTATSQRLNGGGSIVAASVTSTNTAATVFTFTSTDPNLPNVTMTCGSTVFSVGDKFQLDYMPLMPNALVNGSLCADLVNKPNARFRITGNTHNVITVQTGDLTTDGGGAVGDRWMAFWPQRNNSTDTLTTLTPANGYDALATLGDNDYLTTALNPLTSPARRLLVENKGLVKVACPDHPTTAVSKQLLAFAEALNWQARIEMPDTILTENDAVDYINTTIGRSDFGVVSWPSFADVLDPEKDGQLKRTPLTGMIHGREALVANQFQGYHKAAAGLDVVLPKVVQLPTNDLVFNEEITNPQGINVVKRVKGNMILWGDRTICLDPTWKFKHQREQMSHYENRLREGFDYIIFSINSKLTWAQLLVTLKAFFLPEFAKGALSGDKPDQAFAIKIDGENNTAADAANGDLNCDITLKLANTVERFNISIGKAGIFDSVSN